MRFEALHKKRNFSFFPILRIQRLKHIYPTVLAGLIGLMALILLPDPISSKLRMTFFEYLRPVFQTAQDFKTVLVDTWYDFVSLNQLQQKLKKLEAENHHLTKVVLDLKAIEAQNKSLRQLLHVRDYAHPIKATVPVLTSPLLGFHHSLLIAGGLNEGIEENDPVLSGYQVLGRVQEVSQTTARVLLLTDPQSRVPVSLEPSNEHAILAGDGSSLPQLIYLNKPHDIKPGTIVRTSGLGGVYPAGLYIGRIKEILNGIPRVELIFDWSKIRYSHVLQQKPMPIQDLSEDSRP